MADLINNYINITNEVEPEFIHRLIAEVKEKCDCKMTYSTERKEFYFCDEGELGGEITKYISEQMPVDEISLTTVEEFSGEKFTSRWVSGKRLGVHTIDSGR